LLFSNNVNSVYEAFNQVLNNNNYNLNLKKEDINILLDLGKSLGESDIQGQNRIFCLTLENLRKQIKGSESLMNKSVRMYRYLGFLVGTMVVVILV
jgi:stage III sporulation protein AB